MGSDPSSSATTPPFQTSASPRFLDPSLAALHSFLSGTAPSPVNSSQHAGKGTADSARGAPSPGAAVLSPPSAFRGLDSAAVDAFPSSAANFADLLAEFTLQPNALSPDAQGRHGAAGATGGEGMTGVELPGGAAAGHEALMEQLRLLYPTLDSPATAAQSPPQPQPDLQAQLHQLLAGGMPASETPTPTLGSAAASHLFMPPPPHAQHSPQHSGTAPNPYAPPSPSAYSPHPSSSHQPSPMPTYGSSFQQHHPHQQPQQQQQQHSGSSTPSRATYGAPTSGFALPQLFQQMLGSFQPGAAAGADPNQSFLAQQLQNAPFPAQVAALQLLMGAQMQAQVQAQVQAQQAQMYQQQQQHHHQQHQQHQQHNGHAHGQQQQQHSHGMSSGTVSLDGSYRENEYLFSPMMSPAMTPHSTFTNASSLPPSVGPSAVPLVSPADLFPPLTSPALGPQLYNTDGATSSASNGRINPQRNSLQGLVDGVGALSTQLPGGAPGSPAGSYYSPRLGPTDVGTSTGAGAAAGRRGASSAAKKTRPSPLIKPTPDSALERRRGRTKTVSAGAHGERRAGSKSATSSPFLGPTMGGSSGGQGRAGSVMSASGSSSSKASPAEQGGPHAQAQQHGLGGGGGFASFDTPSPVDLASSGYGTQSTYPSPQAQQHYQLPSSSYAHQPSLPGVVEGVAVSSPSVDPQILAMQPPSMLPPQQHAQQQQQHQQPYQLEPMGPPPPPSAGFNPVTPASFMNFSSDFDVNGLSSLSPALGALQAHDIDSALSSLSNSPALLPQPDAAFLPAAMDIGVAAQSLADSSVPASAASATATAAAGEGEEEEEETFVAPPPPSTSKAAPRRKGASVRASPALKPVDAAGTGGASVKGKGKAAAGAGGAGAAGGRKGKAATKVAPSPKIGPSPKIRPLLASNAAPDAQARLAAKSNYENILDGRGPDLLGLPSSMQSELQAAGPSSANGGAAPPVDSRRSSHKVAEQKRRDSLKLCFDELRKLLPPILPYTDERDRRPGDGNVGGQRHGEVDPENPNRGVSKVALLRRSNEYLGILRERIERRDQAISALRDQMVVLRQQLGITELGEEDEEVPGLDLDLDHLDKEEKQAGNLAFYEDLDFDQKVAPVVARRPSASFSRRPSVALEAKPPAAPSRATGTRRSARMSQTAQEDQAMEVEGEE
ncbi:hypothetical protein JCM9279_004772 [Rhodotorula babjevae]